MAYTRAQVEAQIEKLERGMALVESGTTFQDRGVTYRTVEQVERQISYWQRKLDLLNGGRPRQFLVVVRSGL